MEPFDAELKQLIEALNDESVDVRINAAGAIGASGGDGFTAIPALLDACSDPDDFVRDEVAHALWELTCSCVGVIPDADLALVNGLPKLISMLRDSSEDVQSSAIGILKEMGQLACPASAALNDFLATSKNPELIRAAHASLSAINAK